jgi:cytochrome c oxidase subunit 2
MDTHFRLWPETASQQAGRVDALFLFLLGVSAFFTLLIFVSIVYFGLKYRRRPGVLPKPVKTSVTLEVAWSVIPFILTMVMFAWGAGLYVHLSRPPAGALQINVIGKQWMWKVQHPTGAREINQLHVPLGRPVKLVMTSQDVIHSFFIPAFRIKNDVIPGRYHSEWFTATRTGEYHLFCAEYCGDGHSRMIGSVVVMEPAKYQAWLAGVTPDLSPVSAGEKLFTEKACITCHGQRGPGLSGVYGSLRRVVEDGQVKDVTADEAYLRESIINPSKKIVVGFPPLMPTFEGQLTEEQILDLIAYIKSLKEAQPGQPGPAPAGSVSAPGGATAAPRAGTTAAPAMTPSAKPRAEGQNH